MTNDFDIMTDDELYPVEKNLVYLPVEDIYPHPDNPRKDLGDLTELIDSIKSRGILQNLTVVPGHYEADGHYKSGYTVIIGHRRLAAAKEAGIATVPAVIADMTFEEQIATMMTENMQRNDLTMYEQAKGFQQLKLMGWNDTDISKKTGFSKSTVGKRLRVAKLADLDSEGMKEAVGRGATLEDILEIEKLKDPENQAKLFEKLGTPDFHNALLRAIDAKKFENTKAAWIEKLEAAGAEQVDEMPMRSSYIGSLSSWNTNTAFPDLKEGKTYCYVCHSNSITIYEITSEEDEEESEEDRRRRERNAEIERRWSEIESITARHYELRKQFIFKGDYSDVVKVDDLIGFYCQTFTMDHYYNNGASRKDLLKEAFDLDDVFDDDVRKKFGRNAKKAMLIIIFAKLDNASTGYVRRVWYGSEPEPIQYKNNEHLNFMYDILIRLGYALSDEEMMMMNGEHPYVFKGDDDET